LCPKIGPEEEVWRKDRVAAVGIGQMESIALAAVAAGTAQVESLAFLQIGPVAAVRIGQVESIVLAG
jgi:hypothetical protein